MNRAVFRALKPGGLYVIADHAGRPEAFGFTNRILRREI